MTESVFKEILGIKDVRGVFVFSADNGVIHPEFAPGTAFDMDSVDWRKAMEAFQNLREAELLFDNLRLYVRSLGTDYLCVVMGISAPTAMIRLNCDLVLPALQKQKAAKGLKRFFKRGD
jgi:hypothetical protein